MFVLIWMHYSWWFQIWLRKFRMLAFFSNFWELLDLSSAHACRIVRVSSVLTSITQPLDDRADKVVDLDLERGWKNTMILNGAMWCSISWNKSWSQNDTRERYATKSTFIRDLKKSVKYKLKILSLLVVGNMVSSIVCVLINMINTSYIIKI